MWLKTVDKADGADQGILTTSDVSWQQERWLLVWEDAGQFRFHANSILIWIYRLNIGISQWDSVSQPDQNWPSCLPNQCISEVVFDCRFLVKSPLSFFKQDLTPPISTDWFHIALVLYGPAVGISIYRDGVLDGSTLTGSTVAPYETHGDVVLGRLQAERDMNYADVTVDELYFWDEALGTAAIEEVCSWYQ